MKPIKAAVIALFMCAPAFAQVQVSPFLTPYQQFVDNSGFPLVGGKVCTFATGTSTPHATYSDNGSTLNSNPVVLDGAGRAKIYLDSTSYKIVIAASTADNTCTPAITTADPVTWSNTISVLSTLTVTGNPSWATSTAATSGANRTSPQESICGNYWTGSASASDCWIWQDQLGTGSNPTSTLALSHSGSSGAATVSLPALSVPSISGPGIQRQLFTSSGTFTIPVTQVEVTIVGSGASGGAGNTVTPTNGGGGGGGATCTKYLSSLTIGNTLTVTVGAAVTGTLGAAGTNGNNSSISSGSQSITTVTAGGGAAGNFTGAFSNGGLGGTCTSADFAVTGGAGGPGFQAAGPVNVGGFGGVGWNGGQGGLSSNSGVSGANSFGAGGAGSSGSGNNAGGSSSQGLVLFRWIN
jgi:hypothetical protein